MYATLHLICLHEQRTITNTTKYILYEISLFLPYWAKKTKMIDLVQCYFLTTNIDVLYTANIWILHAQSEKLKRGWVWWVVGCGCYAVRWLNWFFASNCVCFKRNEYTKLMNRRTQPCAFIIFENHYNCLISNVRARECMWEIGRERVCKVVVFFCALLSMNIHLLYAEQFARICLYDDDNTIQHICLFYCDAA